MTTRVKAKGPDGTEKLYAYDPQSVPLGSGHTGIVYEGWEESRIDRKVAIKVSRSASDADMQRELEILARLYAPREPGGNAVLWAAGGQEIDTIPGAACMVMELIGGENQMSRRMNVLGQSKLPGADILEKEQTATEAGRQYAQLLVRMSDKGIISRGDRKATDFRLMPDNGNVERLVILDWNRGEIIDIPTLEKEGRSSPEFIKRRRTDLEVGKTGDIRIFARWWAEFVMGRSLTGPLPAIDDKTDSDWAALTRGFRHILLRAEAAGTSRGFVSAVALEQALSRHAEILKMDASALGRNMGELQKQNPPTLRDDMLALTDLAARRKMDFDRYKGYIDWAEKGGQDAATMTKRALDDVKAKAARREEVSGLIDEALRNLGQATPDTAAAHLPLLRWGAVAAAGREVDWQQGNAWNGDVSKLMEAFERLPADIRATDEARNIIGGLGRNFPSSKEGLLPLSLELDLRAARTQTAGIEAFQKLQEIYPAYAAALRMSMPPFDKFLADHDRADNKAKSDSDLDKTLQAAVKALFDQFAADVMTGQLPPADHQAARRLREATYQPRWKAYYDARANLNAAGISLRDDGGEWLDALLTSMLRLRADDAAARLADPTPAATAALRDLLALRRHCFGRWLDLLEKSAAGGEPRWPDELSHTLALVDRISAGGNPATQARAAAMAQQLRDAIALQNTLRRRLGIDSSLGFTTGDSWATLAERITADNSTDISDALRQAVDNRLEVWQPPAVAEDAFDPDYPGRVAEGYRARTLLALRAARLLPANVKEYNEQLRSLATELEDGQRNVALITRSMSAADGYAAHMITLNRMKDELAELKRIKADFDQASLRVSGSAGDIAEDRRKLESWSTKLDALAGEIAAKTNAADEVISQVAPLAQMWLVSALDQAGRLDFNEALASVGTARRLLSDSSLLDEAMNIENAINQLEELSNADDGFSKAWVRLQRVRDAMSAGNRETTINAWREVRSHIPDWEANRVLQRLDQRIMAMPEKPPTPQPAAPPVPDTYRPGATEGKAVLGPTSTMLPTQQTQSPANEEKAAEITNSWRSFAGINPTQRPNSQRVKPMVEKTDELLKNSLSQYQLKSLSQQVKQALGLEIVDWESSDFMSDENNFGHLYALNYKIEQLMKNNR